MAGLPSSVAAGILGPEPASEEGKPREREPWRRLPSRGRCDSRAGRAAGSPSHVSEVGGTEGVPEGGRRGRGVGIPHSTPCLAAGSLEDPISVCVRCNPPSPEVNQCRDLCYDNPILCLHTCRDGELTTTLLAPGCSSHCCVA